MSEGAGRPPGARGIAPQAPDSPLDPTASEILRALRAPIDAGRFGHPDERPLDPAGSMPSDAVPGPQPGPPGADVTEPSPLPSPEDVDAIAIAIAAAPATTTPVARSPRPRIEGRFARWYVEPRVRAEEEEPWLLTYLDTITLLLVMMIVLLIFAGPPVPPGQHRRHPAQTDSGAPAKAPEGTPSAERPEGGPAAPRTEGAAGDGTKAAVKDGTEAKPADATASTQAGSTGGEAKDTSPVVDLTQLSPNIRMERRPDEIRFRLDSEILFASGNAALLPAGQAMIDELLPVFLASPDQEIVVGGHTDDVPVRGWRFPSNWELAAGRAASVVRHLESRGIAPARLRAVAFGDTRPIASNDTAEGRAANRRVEISIENRARADQPARSEALRQKQ